MEESNSTTDPDTIAFGIPGAGPHAIAPLVALPDLTEPIVIDGFTQPGATPNSSSFGQPCNAQLMIELDGSQGLGGPFGPSALNITGGNSVVRGLVINGVGGSAVRLLSDGNVVEGCFLGTDVSGTVGVSNGGSGVYIGSMNSWNRVGGVAPESRNILSHNNSNGVFVSSGDHTQVLGNFIGTDATGTIALGNQFDGIRMTGADCTIAGNLISGNGRWYGAGVELGGSGTQPTAGTVVRGNFIGTDVAGTRPLGNDIGIDFSWSTDDVLVGGPNPGDGNLISGNYDHGIAYDRGTNTRIEGNLIGTDVSGVRPLGNGSAGIYVISTARNNTIGGEGTGCGNVIAFNGGGGVEVMIPYTSVPLYTRIIGNSIHSNGGLGIELEPLGVNPNDPGDTDDGANEGQNYPVLSSAATAPGITIVSGYLDSEPSTEYRLEFFSNHLCDPSTHGEGRLFLGSWYVTTDAAGIVSFIATLPTLAVGTYVTTTATDPEGNTSEFSGCEITSTVSLNEASWGSIKAKYRH
jgi:hypothetical protein